MITNLIEPPMGKLIVNHLIGNTCLKFCNGLLNTYFFKLTLEKGCLGRFWTATFKPILTQ